jgi:MauM/NapG family ferredoxin protein
VVQLVFLAAFFLLLIRLRPIPGGGVPSYSDAFLRIDPLVHLVTVLAAHTLAAGIAWTLALILLTLVLGRFFCGWVCPLGTLHGITGRFFGLFQRRPRPEHTSRWQIAKYVVLIAVLVAAAGGSSWLVLLDPLVILQRSAATALLPALQACVEDGATAIYQSDPGVGSWRVTTVTEPAYSWLRDHAFVKSQQAFLAAVPVLGFLMALFALNAVRRRFWCRYICPLGAMLGVFAWRPWLRRKVDAKICNQCDLCGMGCHGAASAVAGAGWKASECFGCLNCTDSCNRNGIGFEVTPPWQARARDESIDLSRRDMLGGVVAGATTWAFLRISPEARGAEFNPDLIRPPGARNEREFLARCTACGLCMKVCPTGGLQPSWAEAGLAGLWTPHLTPRIGYCDFSCNRCGSVCPTAAIEPLTVPIKQKTRIGLASFDTSRCLPYAYARNCIVCEEHCPVPDKAIYFKEVEVTTRAGEKLMVRQPHVDPERCIGCGICENVCPFRDRPAVRVTSANESRHPANQPILQMSAGSSYPGV